MQRVSQTHGHTQGQEETYGSRQDGHVAVPADLAGAGGVFGRANASLESVANFRGLNQPDRTDERKERSFCRGYKEAEEEDEVEETTGTRCTASA